MFLLFLGGHAGSLRWLSIPIEILCVCSVSNLRDPRRRDLSSKHCIPIYSSKPLMSFDVFRAILKLIKSYFSYLWTTKTYTSVSTKETFDQISSLRLNVRWKLIVTIHDFLIDTKRIIIVEGGIASEHLEDQNTESPPVNEFIMTFRLNNLWSKVLWGAT